MSSFLVFAALLVAGALLLVVPPLVRRHGRQRPQAEADQASTALAVLREQLADLETERAAGRVDAETYTRSRDELERRALEEGAREAATTPGWQPARGWGVALLVGLPAVAAVLYLLIGNPAGLDPALATGGQQQYSQEQIEGMVAKLAARMADEPDNLEGWMMLARSQTMLGRSVEAEKAYRHLAAKMPDNAQVLADWADALGAAQGGTLVGEPEQIIARALKLEPGNIKALALAGSVAFEKADYTGAAGNWEKILAQLPPGEELAASVRAGVEEARAKAGLPPLAGAAPAAPVAPAVAATAPGPGLQLSGEIRLAPALAAQAKPEDAVFVFARAGEGGPPIAALRFTVAQLPAHFDFAQATLMARGGALPDRVVVGARISRSGQPVGASGDLEGYSVPVVLDAKGVTVTVDRVRP